MDNLDYFENVRNRLESILKISNNLQKQVNREKGCIGLTVRRASTSKVWISWRRRWPFRGIISARIVRSSRGAPISCVKLAISLLWSFCRRVSFYWVFWGLEMLGTAIQCFWSFCVDFGWLERFFRFVGLWDSLAFRGDSGWLGGRCWARWTSFELLSWFLDELLGVWGLQLQFWFFKKIGWFELSFSINHPYVNQSALWYPEERILSIYEPQNHQKID